VLRHVAASDAEINLILIAAECSVFFAATCRTRCERFQLIHRVRLRNMDSFELDDCIVWNAHNTVLGSKRLAVCATV